MKSKRLTIQINKPINDVFKFTITPPNSTLWIDGVVEEKTNEWPVRVGTVYKLKNKKGEYSEVSVNTIIENKVVEWISKDQNYHCRYTFRSLNKNLTELKYFEWVDKGNLEDPFTLEIFQKLKVVLEQCKGLSWTVGEVEIFQIIEIQAGELIQSTLKSATPENIQKIQWLYPHFADEKGNLKALVQSLLVKSEGKYILIDTCNGNGKTRPTIPEWGNLNTDYLKKLNDLGVSELEIDFVICTHLHFDHVGWNTRLENFTWVPTFPNARCLFSKKEYDYWIEKPEKEIDDDKFAFDYSVAPIVKARLAKLVDNNYKIDKNLRLISTPGHTPDHVSIMIESEGKRAIISGDFLHHPCQIANPNWTMDADTLPDIALQTREKLLNHVANSSILLIGSHFSNPVAGLIKKAKDGFIFEV